MEEIERLRSESTEVIANSSGEKRLIVAGLGTGKTRHVQEGTSRRRVVDSGMVAVDMR